MLVDRCVLQDSKFIQKTLYFGKKKRFEELLLF